ncbi:hypothetical protein INR49_008264, partial [Caranx melampygus]
MSGVLRCLRPNLESNPAPTQTFLLPTNQRFSLPVDVPPSFFFFFFFLSVFPDEFCKQRRDVGPRNVTHLYVFSQLDVDLSQRERRQIFGGKTVEDDAKTRAPVTVKRETLNNLTKQMSRKQLQLLLALFWFFRPTRSAV